MIQPHLYFNLLEKKRAFVGHGRWTTWKLFEQRAKALSDVDFDCRFDSAGACKIQQGIERGGTVQNCCQQCAVNGGYLMAVKPGTAWAYARAWDAEFGFWRPGQGCILPRERRSFTCLVYNCHDKGHNCGSTRFDPYQYMANGDTKLIQIAMVKK